MARGDFIVDGHLGGYVEGGDPNTTYPTLWRWLVDEFASFGDDGSDGLLDVGCGDGAAVRWFDSCPEWSGSVWGIDGLAPDDPVLLRHDYTLGPSVVRDRFVPFDLVWSCEFVEHVAERHVYSIVRDLAYGMALAMTHALPGQPGHHHVNCKPSAYWQALMEQQGMRLDPDRTQHARELARLDVPGDACYFGVTGLVFVRDSIETV